MTIGDLLSQLQTDFESIMSEEGGAWADILVFPEGQQPGRPMRAIVNDRHLEGSREADGDGIAGFNQAAGRKFRESVTIYTTGTWDDNGTERRVDFLRRPTTDRFDLIKTVDEQQTYKVKRDLSTYNGALYKLIAVNTSTQKANQLRTTG